MGQHTVEKIGGTSMTRFHEVLENLLIGSREKTDIYNRVFVVSAYGGVTNYLLENKKNADAGIYKYFAANDAKWTDCLDETLKILIEFNHSFKDIGLNITKANEFVTERMNAARECMQNLHRLCSYSHFNLNDNLPAIREMLSSIGEAQSAFNSVDILKNQGINAVFADLTGWSDHADLPFDDKIQESFKDIDFKNNLVIATGYTKCREGIMKTFDRGYSEITFSKIATITQAKEAVIHKEFHLSSGDPGLIDASKLKTIGQTNFDVADQLSDLGMEAIHPQASKAIETNDIPLRIKNAFEPKHPGTLITKSFKSKEPRVEIITGRRDLIALEVWDPDMVGQSGYDYKLVSFFAEANISYIAKNTNANTITHYFPKVSEKKLEKLIVNIKNAFHSAVLRTLNVAIVSAIGSNIKFPGFLAKASTALALDNINILAIDQCMRQVNMQFVVAVEDFENAVKSLHKGVVEK